MRGQMPIKSSHKSSSREKQARQRRDVLTSENDGLAPALCSLVPDEYIDSDSYLNIVQWNMEWFGAAKSKPRDKKRYKLVRDILATFNADVFVLQEVAGPSLDGRYRGVLDSLAEELTAMGRGDYRVEYTTAGGEQRVAAMWDRDFVHAKSEVTDLFERGKYQRKGEKDPFGGRTPLYGYFEGRVVTKGEQDADRIDLQLLGVHLKAMADGLPQRQESARILIDWLNRTAPTIDSDVLIMGDWNAAPDDPSWDPIREEEAKNARIHFSDINDPSDFSYLWLANKSDKYVSKIDLTAMTLSSETQPPDEVARVVRWKPITEALQQAGHLTDSSVRNVMSELKEQVSDHLPTITRFFFKRQEQG